MSFILSLTTNATRKEFENYKLQVLAKIEDSLTKDYPDLLAKIEETITGDYIKYEELNIPFYLLPSYQVLNVEKYVRYIPHSFVRLFLEKCDEIVGIVFSDDVEKTDENLKSILLQATEIIANRECKGISSQDRRDFLYHTAVNHLPLIEIVNLSNALANWHTSLSYPTLYPNTNQDISKETE